MIREYRDDDLAAIRICIVELQESERRIDDRLRPGESMARLPGPDDRSMSREHRDDSRCRTRRYRRPDGEVPDTVVTVDMYPVPDAPHSDKLAIEPGVIIDVLGGAGQVSAGAPTRQTDAWLNIRVKERSGWIRSAQAARIYNVPRRHRRQ